MMEVSGRGRRWRTWRITNLREEDDYEITDTTKRERERKRTLLRLGKEITVMKDGDHRGDVDERDFGLRVRVFCSGGNYYGRGFVATETVEGVRAIAEAEPVIIPV